MQRFNNDDNEEFDEEYTPYDDSYLDDENEDNIKDNYIYITGDAEDPYIKRRELNQKLLFRVIKMLERSWLWNFYSAASQNKKIIETFMSMKSILDLTEDEDFIEGE